MRTLMILSTAALIAGCGGVKPEVAESATAPQTYTMVDLHYTPALRKACGESTLKMPKFAFDSAKLNGMAKAEMRGLAACLNRPEMAKATVALAGHTDPRGDSEYNKALGKDRAQAVSEFLISEGVQKERIRVMSHGERHASGLPWNWSDDRNVAVDVKGVKGTGTWSTQRVEITYFPNTGPLKLAEKEDIDGDGVEEPALYPTKDSKKADARSDFKETGDTDGDGVDEPAKKGM